MKPKNQSLTPLVAKLCLGGVMMATAAGLQAQTADAGRLERLEKENTDLRKRLDSWNL